MTAGVLASPLLVPPTPSGALGTSPFCAAVFSYAEHPITPPKTLTISGWHTYAKELVPYFSRMASTAPNAASKTTLNEIVTILKYYSAATSTAKLVAYENAHRSQWLAGTKALAAAVKNCA